MKKFFCFILFLSGLLAAASEKPLAVAGLVSDTHVTDDPRSCIPLEKAFRLFKKHKVDLIINAGDVADVPNAQAYAHYRETIKKVYPDKKPPELFPLAWHDVIGYGSYQNAWTKGWPDFKKNLEIQHGFYAKHKLAGYIFLVFPQIPDYAVYEKMIADACRETPDKPVFLVDHYPAARTVYRSKTWGNGRRRDILDKYPQVIQLCGHIHADFRRENAIWQGNFTVINVSCCRQAKGNVPLAGQALIMEIYPGKVLFRRFDVMTGREYKSQERWCIPLPHVPEKAPYTAEKRKQLPVPEFADSCRIGIKPDKIPCNALDITFDEARFRDGVFVYRLTLFRKDPSGKWESCAVLETPGGYRKEPAQRKKITCSLSAGYIESGREYKIRIEPFNFFDRCGKAVEKVFTAPEKQKHKVRFESKDPMKECFFRDGFTGRKTFPVENGYYLFDGDNACLLFPPNVWSGPLKTRFRFTVDLRMIQPDPACPWTLVLHHLPPNPHGRIYTSFGNSGLRRYVVEISRRHEKQDFYLLVREGRAGKIRFEYVKIEELL